MSINRRHMISSGLGAAAFFSTGSVFYPTKAAEPIIELTARVSTQKLYGEKGPGSELWSFNGTSPGPEIRVRRGDRVRVRLINKLPQPTSIHWHGIRIVNAMDGVAGLTQDPVPPGATFEYDFVVPDTGTYWYHAHNRSWEQVARGLYGALIVDEETQIFDRAHDFTMMMDDWRLKRNGTLDVASLGDFMDWTHGGRLGNWLTVNGHSLPDFSLVAGEVYRIRLINASNARIFAIDPNKIGAKIIGYDGQMLAEPELPSYAPLLLGPAQRVDLLLHPQKAGTIEMEEVSGREPFPFAKLQVATAKGAQLSAPSLVKSQLPEPDLKNARMIPLIMEGGAMGRRGKIVYQGKELTEGDFRRTKQVWAFNGIANLAEQPFFKIQQGETVIVDTDNQTAFPHAMHVHGHHFQVIERNQSTLIDKPWRDTFLVDEGHRVKIAFVADNPGKWLLHCHMLEHAAAGMQTWFEVV